MKKIFFWVDEQKYFRTADAVRRRRCEGPHRFTQKRPRTFVSGLPSIAAVETSKHWLSRDFQRRSIFDFFNSIGTFRTSPPRNECPFLGQELTSFRNTL